MTASCAFDWTRVVDGRLDVRVDGGVEELPKLGVVDESLQLHDLILQLTMTYDKPVHFIRMDLSPRGDDTAMISLVALTTQHSRAT